MELTELKSVLASSDNLEGCFSKEDIDFFVRGGENHYEYVKVNDLIIPFRRICIGTQRLSKHLEDTYLLFKQCQIRIRDIRSIEFDPDFVAY